MSPDVAARSVLAAFRTTRALIEMHGQLNTDGTAECQELIGIQRNLRQALQAFHLIVKPTLGSHIARELIG